MWQFAVTQRLPATPARSTTPDARDVEPSARDFLRAIEEAIREVEIEAEAQAWHRDLVADLQASLNPPPRPAPH